MESCKESELGKGKPLVWDADSSLYDSFELNSFKKQLDMAMASRTLSMSHLSDRRAAPTIIPLQPKKSSKISRSLQKLVRSIFRPKLNSDIVFGPQERPAKDGRVYNLCDEVGTLSTIREAPEIDLKSSFSRKTASARFSVNSIGISCA